MKSPRVLLHPLYQLYTCNNNPPRLTLGSDPSVVQMPTSLAETQAAKQSVSSKWIVNIPVFRSTENQLGKYSILNLEEEGNPGYESRCATGFGTCKGCTSVVRVCDCVRRGI